MERRFSVQLHKQKNKKHIDLRIENPQKTKLISFAFPKARFPEYGERLLVIKTFDHKLSYIDFDGRLENGDIVTLLDIGSCSLISYKKDSYINVFFHGQLIKGLYIFLKLRSHKDHWLVLKSKKF